MIERIDISMFKNKFATLLSKLFYSASLSLEQISFKIVNTNIFNFIEENKVQDFMDKQYSELAKEMFNVPLLYDSDDINPVYWAGIQYINILMTSKIPLRQLFILCPLKEMVAHYEIYHEMNENQLINEFLNNEYKRSILSSLIKTKGTSFNKLSLLTGIGINTLKHYSRSNDMLFKASFNNINLIMHALDVNDISVFQKESFFVNVNSIFSDNEKRKILIDSFKEYIGIDEVALDIYERDYTKKDSNGIYIGAFNIVKYKRHIKSLTDEEVLLLMRKPSSI